jgi:hypothetical protein
MPAEHTFNVIIVVEGHGIGGGVTAKANKTVHYSGAKTEVKF